MKNRTPKYPGRVKMTPVAGQTDVYDMERADDPDDTGTPFNKRTMLQDSTGQFLKLPLANPFPDDAFRHMVDRIVPIGTIRTSPAQSLGDAWLKCDGSQVTFSEYPQLCQLLRGISDDGATWSGTAFPVSGRANSVSKAVFFDGRWIVAFRKTMKSIGSNSYESVISILSASKLDGTWTEEHTVTTNIATAASPRLHIACTDSKCLILFPSGPYGQTKLGRLCCVAGSRTWSNLEDHESGYKDTMTIYGLDAHDDVFAWAIPGSNGTTIYHTTTPETISSWQSTILNQFPQYYWGNVSFGHVNENWVMCGTGGYNETGTSTKFLVAVSSDASNFEFSIKEQLITKMKYGANAISDVCFMNGKYYTLIDGAATYNNDGNVVLASSLDLANWEYQIISENNGYANNGESCAIAASGTILVFANKWHTWTTGDPTAVVNEATLPAGAIPQHCLFVGDTAYAIMGGSIAYHDYSTETRILPTISLSDDTTTFIKAKNELDVFEAQQSGG